MTRIERFHEAADEYARNRLLRGWLSDDGERAAFYAELGQAGFPILRFRSMGVGDWARPAEPEDFAYLVTQRAQIKDSLQLDSVEPYAQLDSGGRFMLGIDDRARHAAQRGRAEAALNFSAEEIAAAAREAVRLAMILPTKTSDFDLVRGVAQQAAIHFVQLLFGLPAEEHIALERAMDATYVRLAFQIVGRHFDPDSGLPTSRAPAAQKIRADLEHAVCAHDPRVASRHERRPGAPARAAIARLRGQAHMDDEELRIVSLGLMAGAIGNITAAVSIAIEHFFAATDATTGQPLIDQVCLLARTGHREALQPFIGDALTQNPPAAFLARQLRRLDTLHWTDGEGNTEPVPVGANLLLGLGADAGDVMRFGGAAHDLAFPHSCVGQHLVRPLVLEAVYQVLRLPGLTRDLDPQTGRPKRLVKQWGNVCTEFKLRFQRDHLMNQQPLFVVLPIKEPIAENRKKLELLTIAGAHIVEDALAKSRHVHFAWFEFVEGGTHLALATVYDGDFDAYVEFFALAVPLFDKQFDFLDVELPRPIQDHPKQFVEVIRKYNREPVARYLFSAYPKASTARLQDLLKRCGP